MSACRQRFAEGGLRYFFERQGKGQRGLPEETFIYPTTEKRKGTMSRKEEKAFPEQKGRCFLKTGGEGNMADRHH